MAELIDGRALLADGVVFDFGEGTVRKSGLCQSILVCHIHNSW